ncbi:conserved hypothetical protein [Pseudoalteromonas sp. 3J6]|uniref:hypothetical protein n=1 Tax=Pseudoalteromonas sp. 3J6 TaxID=649161 RepID=UPI001762A432|nr:hypothetical protein [Pseudoalteromonas sp. 3J6]CAD2223608.1 conserved hypothetical protein [Pseudoalteromonas sp. 3J6]
MFKKEVVEFSDNLESLRDFIELVDAHLNEKNSALIGESPTDFAPLMLLMKQKHPEDFDEKKISKLVDGFGSKIDFIDNEEEKSTKIKLDHEGSKKFAGAMKRLAKTQKRKASLHQSSLVTIISYVEWFLAQLIHRYYEKNPNAIGLKDKQLSLNDLYEIGSIEDAKKYLIDTKVESVLRGSFKDWVTFLKEQMGLSMGYLKESEEILIEACQRRNLYVHNGGVVNSIYIKNCHFKDSDAPEIGNKLTCDNEYIEAILTSFEKSFLLISAELWKKCEPKNRDRFKVLIEMGHDHICNERYDIGKSLSYFLWGDKGQKEIDQIVAQINYWQSIKWKGEFSSIQKDVKNTDFSAKDSLFILAQHTLLDEFDEAFDLIPDVLKTDKLNFESLSEWPLFKELRAQDKYKDIVSKFGPSCD